MKKWITDTGRSVTADTAERAAALAAQYGLGAIVSAQAVTRPAKPSAATDDQYIIWDDLCQAVRASGLAEVVQALNEGDLASSEMVMIRLPSGRLRTPTRAENARIDEALQ